MKKSPISPGYAEKVGKGAKKEKKDLRKYDRQKKEKGTLKEGKIC